MNQTSIEWVKNPDGSQGYTWNPITGCLNHVNGICKGGGFPCYAYKLANTRLKERYLANSILPIHDEPDHESHHSDPFYPRFWPDKLDQPLKRKKPVGIFTCDMSDLFGIGVPEQWTWSAFNFIKECPQHRFYLLTKQPQNLAKFSPFPNNCWVGATCTSRMIVNGTLRHLMKVGAGKIFLSLEPLLNWEDGSAKITGDRLLDAGIDWLIIGAMTGQKGRLLQLQEERYPQLRLEKLDAVGRKWTLLPRLEWVKDIVLAADGAGIPVFLKDNIYKLAMDRPTEDHDLYWEDMSTLRQELPYRSCGDQVVTTRKARVTSGGER